MPKHFQAEPLRLPGRMASTANLNPSDRHPLWANSDFFDSARIFTPAQPEILAASVRDYCSGVLTHLRYSIMAEVRTETPEQRFVNDMVAILTSFAGKLHRQRRGRMHPT